MAIQESERLRQMVNDYYHGLLTEDSYREQRAQLLDNIGADVTERSETTTQRRQPAAGKSSSIPPPVQKDPPDSTSSFKPKMLLIGGIVVAGIAAAVYVVVMPMTDSETVPDSQEVQSESVAESGLESGDALLGEFLERNDWSSDSLSNFLLTWSLLNDDQREKAVDGRRYRRLTTRLHQRIGEEAALSNASNNDRMKTLTGFAATIGAPYRETVVFEPMPKPDVAVATDTEEKPADTRFEPKVIVAAGDSVAIVPLEKTQDEQVAPQVTAPPVVVESSEPDDEVIASVEPTPADSVAAPAPAPSDDPCPGEIAITRQPYCRDKLADDDVGPPLVVLRSGTYEMGSNADASESPPHQVAIAYQIAISRFEITAQEYEQFCVATSLPCEDRPWDADYPVVAVSWDDAVQYTQWLSEATGFMYRLPSEAEWEYAARAGTQSPYYFGDEITPTAAHSSANGPVDSPVPKTDRTINRNPFRLYHISGNVREWTQDAWYPNYDNAPANGSSRMIATEDRRVVRGGSFSDPKSRLRSAAREPLARSHRDALTGFRIVREVLPQATDK